MSGFNSIQLALGKNLTVISKLVAIRSTGADDNRAYTSDDNGASWTPRAISKDGVNGIPWHSLCYSIPLNRVVAVGDRIGNTDTAYSDDGGQTWTACTTTTIVNNHWTGCIRDEVHGFFVAFQNGAGTSDQSVRRSADGITWTNVAHGLGNYAIPDMAVNPVTGRIVAILIPNGGGAADFGYSDDGGLTWTKVATGLSNIQWATNGFGTQTGGAAWGASLSLFNAVGNSLSIFFADGFARAADGTAWTGGSFPFAGIYPTCGLIFLPSNRFATVTRNSSDTRPVFTSINGTAYVQSTFAHTAGFNWTRIRYDHENDKALMIGSDLGTGANPVLAINTATDLSTFSLQALPVSGVTWQDCIRVFNG